MKRIVLKYPFQWNKLLLFKGLGGMIRRLKIIKTTNMTFIVLKPAFEKEKIATTSIRPYTNSSREWRYAFLYCFPNRNNVSFPVRIIIFTKRNILTELMRMSFKNSPFIGTFYFP